MPSKKPIIQAVMEEETYKKYKQLCTNDSRSASKLAGLIIKKYVNDYEAIHGEIVVEEKNNSDN